MKIDNKLSDTNSNLDYIKQKLKELTTDKEYFYIYKHLSFDQNLHVMNAIKNNQLKYTYPNDFNDPYDCMFSVTVDFKDLKKSYAEKFLGVKIKPSDWFKSKNQFKAYMKNKLSNDLMNSLRDNMAVTCFNNNPLNILMWSHYAKNHTGFLMEFRFPIDQLSNMIDIPLPITYTEKFPTVEMHWDFINYFDNLDVKMECTKKMLLTKATCWQYENEYRWLLNKEPNQVNNIAVKEYNPLYLSSIVLGSKISDVHKKLIEDEISLFNKKHDLKVKIYQSNLSDNQFRINVPKHPRLDENHV